MFLVRLMTVKQKYRVLWTFRKQDGFIFFCHSIQAYLKYLVGMLTPKFVNLYIFVYVDHKGITHVPHNCPLHHCLLLCYGFKFYLMLQEHCRAHAQIFVAIGLLNFRRGPNEISIEYRLQFQWFRWLQAIILRVWMDLRSCVVSHPN